MAGSQINSYAIGDVNLTSVLTTLDATRIGFCAVSLTNYATTGVPAIAAGSKIEVDGALFKFDAEEAIGGSPSNGTVYIKLIPAGTSITAEFTNTAPTWSTEKQGWYSPTAGEESYRYLPFGMTKSGSSYSSKYEMVVPAVAGFKAFSDGALSLAGLLQASTTIAFRARLASAVDYVIDSASNQYRTVVMTETLDTVGCFASGQFVAPVAGIYLFTYTACAIAAGYTYFTPMGSLSPRQIYYQITKNPDGYGIGTNLGSVAPSFTYSGEGPYSLVYDSGIGFSTVAQLAAGDVVVPSIYKGFAASGQVRLRSSETEFCGVKIA